MIKKVLICISLALPLCLSVNAQNSAPLPVLNYDANVRSAGMGESVMGESKGMFLYANPTSFLFEERKIYGSYTYGLFPSSNDDRRIHFNGASVGYRLGKQAIMAGFRSWSGLEIDKGGEDGISRGNIKPLDVVIDIAYVRQLTEHLSSYITGNYIYSDLGKTANTGSGGAGLFYRNYLVPCREEWAFCIGAAIRNLGGKVKYDKQSYDLPTSVDMGGSLAIPIVQGHVVNTTVATRYLMLPSEAKAWSAGLGAEYELFGIFDIRGGYHFGRSNHYATVGLGGRIKQMLDIDVSYRASGSNDISNGNKWRFGIGVLF